MQEFVKDLIQQGDDLFTQRRPLLTRWQEIALNFYVERADFTVQRTIGSVFADHLTTSYPLMVRRELGDTIGAMLRPSNKNWLDKITTAREDKETTEDKRWLEWACNIQRNAMKDPVALLSRATKEGDHDFSAFGQTVLSAEVDHDKSALLYRCWHLRDVAWAENASGVIAQVHRNWKPTTLEAVKYFGKKCHQKITEARAKEPFKRWNFRHVVLPADEYAAISGKKSVRQPFVSIWIDIDNQFLMEDVGIWTMYYIIPRWLTVSGSQYAYSPATTIALPDARLLQDMTLVLLEAGQKTVDPPRIMPADMLRSDLNLFAGGVTTYDAEYDEKTGAFLRAVYESKGMPIGLEMLKDTREQLASAFYLNKIKLPFLDGKERTAYESGQIVQEYIRQALPLFEPMEGDYNGKLCADTFTLLQHNSAFGSPYNMPATLRGADVQFRFKSSLSEAIEAQKAQEFMQGKSIIAEAAAIDPSVAKLPKVQKITREVLEGIGWSAEWLKSDEEFAEEAQKLAEEQAQQALIQKLGAGAEVANTMGQAAKSFGEAGLNQVAA